MPAVGAGLKLKESYERRRSPKRQRTLRDFTWDGQRVSCSGRIPTARIRSAGVAVRGLHTLSNDLDLDGEQRSVARSARRSQGLLL